MRAAWLVVALVASGGCLEAPGVVCGDRICPPGATCDAVTGGCLVDDVACDGKADGDACDLVSGGTGYCDRGACLLPVCGDGSIAPTGEECEGDVASVTCTDLGFYVGDTVGCSACRYDTSGCTGTCGDGEIQDTFNEACEGTTPPVGSCLDYGFERGHLGCSLCRPGFARCGDIGWIDASTGSPVDLSAVTESAGDLFAVGSDFVQREAVVMRRVGGGWSVMNVFPFPVGRVITLTSVHATSPSDIWVVGYHTTNPSSSYTGLVYHFDGTTWTEETVANGQLVDVWTPAAGEVFVALTNRTNISVQVRHLSGGSWTTSDVVAGQATGIWGANASDVYLTTTAGVRHWNGSAWSTFQSMSSATGDVHGFSATDVYFLTSTDVLHWNGSTVSPTGAAIPPTATAQRLDGTAMSGLVAVFGTRVLHFDGAIWRDITGNLPLRNAAGITTRSEQVFVVGVGGGAHRYSGSAWRTVDVMGPQSSIVAVHATDAGLIYAIDGPRDVWRRDVDGTWTDVASNATALWGTGDIVVIATVSSPTSSTVTTFGATVPPLAVGTPITGVAGTSVSDIQVTGDAGVAYHYDGLGWSSVTTPAGTGLIEAPACRPNGECFAVDQSGTRILRTPGHGAAWTVEDTGAVAVPLIGGMWANDEAVWAVGRAGAILRKTSAGWETVASGTTKNLASVQGIATNDVWIGALDGPLLHDDGTGIELVEPASGVVDVVANALGRIGDAPLVGGSVKTGSTFVPSIDVLERTTPW